jgi:hypothetical protein
MNKFLATISVGTLMALAVPGVAGASGGGGGTTVAGVCSASSTSKLNVKADNGLIETQFEVDSNVVGQVWRVSISDNGTVVAHGRKTTTAPSGSFEFRRRIANQAGTDSITATAKNKATGETCSATVSF